MNSDKSEKTTEIRFIANEVVQNTPNLSIQKLSDRIFVAEQCWCVKTIFREKRNNAEELADFLNKKYEKNYMIWRFCDRKNISAFFRNVQIYGNMDFNIKNVLSVVKSIKLWLCLDERNVAVIEKKTGESKMAFLCACVLRYCNGKFETSKILELAEFALLFDNSFKTKQLVRYCGYFEEVYLRKEVFPVKTFFQIIISCPDEATIEALRNYDELILRIENESRCVSIYMPDERIYRDEYYVVYTINEELSGDVKFTLFSYKKNEKKLVECNFNTFFMQDSMYRFVKCDMEINAMAGIKNIVIDVAMKVNETQTTKHNYLIDNNKIETLKNMIDHFYKKFDVDVFKDSALYGYNKIGCTFFLLLDYSLDEAQKRCDKFLKLNTSRENDKKVPGTKIESLRVGKVEVIDNKKIDNEVIEDEEKKKYFEKEKKYNFEVLDEIKEDAEFVNKIPNRIKIEGRKGPPKMKKIKKEEIVDIDVVARRPLHFATLSTPDTSIFKDLEGLKIDFDTEKFEEWFCESRIEQETEIIKTENKNEGVILGQRLFLIQLACKNLEKKGADINNLNHFINYKYLSIETGDLLNIRRLFLTEKERKLLTEAEILTELEQTILNISNNDDIVRSVDLLLYDKEATDEIQMVKKTLSGIKICLTELLENKSVKLILKHVLEMSNAVNYRYTKNKKRIDSFRIECLKKLSDYKGKRGDQSLLTFLVHSLNDRKIEVIQDLIKFEPLNRLKNENINGCKDIINKLIKGHKYCAKTVSELKDIESVKEYLIKSLGFLYDSLKDLSVLYFSCTLLIKECISKFTDNPNENINNILVDFMDFFNSLLKSLGKQSD